MMRCLLALLSSMVALALVPFALDWRSPFLFAVRSWALKGLIVVPLSVILVEAWVLYTSRPIQRTVRVLASVGLIAAALALSTTVVREARFRWVRHEVLQADATKLEKLGRHLIVGYVDQAEVRRLVRLKAVGGIFLSSRNVRGKSVTKIRQEMQSFQAERREQGVLPLWIATDQEGGIVSRLSPPLPRQPSLSEVVKRGPGELQRYRAVRRYAENQARGLANVGVNLNFAPVVDLNHQVVNPDDRYTRIYRRAISSDPKVVAQVARWYCKALEEAGVRCTLKHFPGLGRVFEDTHFGHANLGTCVTELSETDWVPFRILMRETKAFTMLGHVRLTALDSDRPVSLSPAVVAGLIRGKWNHDGLMITDNFSMYAVYRSRCGIENGSVQALNAGVDLILVSYDPDQYYPMMYALLKADQEGKLDPNILQRSDRRLERAINLISRYRFRPVQRRRQLERTAPRIHNEDRDWRARYAEL